MFKLLLTKNGQPACHQAMGSMSRDIPCLTINLAPVGVFDSE